MSLNTLYMMLYGHMNLPAKQKKEILKALQKTVHFGDKYELERGSTKTRR